MSIQSESHESILDETESIKNEEQTEPITRAKIRQVAQDLGIIILCWPEILHPEFENRIHFPKSYYTTSQKERLALFYAENFRKQFAHYFPDRKPIILAAPNECKLQKLVCTTITPAFVYNRGLKDWKTAASFVADHITYEPLERPTFFPDHILCPNTVFRRQLGNSYEMSTALCSLLLGFNYDAYVVSGYATQDITECIQIRTECPVKPAEEKKDLDEGVKPKKKYELKPMRDLRSKFMMELEQRKVDEAERLKQEELERQRKEQEELEKAPPDPLFGWRVHSWVLLLPKLDVQEPTFVEPSTGVAYPIDTNVYISLESLWNTENYWVNMQDCSKGLGNLKFDFTDISCWEHIFPGEPIEHRKAFLDPEYEGEINTALEEKHLDMPHQWPEPLQISHDTIVSRFPSGCKTTLYKRTLLKQYGEYVQSDGLRNKITYFKDFECTELLSVEDLYENRQDYLTRITTKNSQITEYFDKGRKDGCKVHKFNIEDNQVESERTIEYYPGVRRDCLVKLEVDPLYTKQYFENNPTKLSFRHTTYAPRGHPPPGMVEGIRRIVTNIIEKFERDESKEAYKDIACREFAIVENIIYLKYHYVDGHITANTREFIKPSVTELGEKLTFNPDSTAGYVADVNQPTPKSLELFTLLQQLLDAEHMSLKEMRDLEDNITGFIRLRAIECAAPQLNVPVWNKERNEGYREVYKEKEQLELEQKVRQIDEEMDYLAPYIKRLGDELPLSKQQAQLVRNQCLAEFKELMVLRANKLKDNFENVYNEYQDLLWRSNEMSSVDIEDDEKRLDDLANKKHQLQILSIRINRHREMSYVRYKYLESYVDADSRLAALMEEKD